MSALKGYHRERQPRRPHHLMEWVPARLLGVLTCYRAVAWVTFPQNKVDHRALNRSLYWQESP